MTLFTPSPNPGPTFHQRRSIVRLSLALSLALALVPAAAAQQLHLQQTSGSAPSSHSNSLPPMNSLMGSGSGSRTSTTSSRSVQDRAYGTSLVAPVKAPHLSLLLGLGGRWWDDHKTIKKLNLRPDQQQRMDGVFEANRTTLVNLYTNLQHEETRLATLPPAELRDEAKVFAAIDRVAQARSDLEKENVHMLLQVRQQLDPDQLALLDQQISKQH